MSCDLLFRFKTAKYSGKMCSMFCKNMAHGGFPPPQKNVPWAIFLWLGENLPPPSHDGQFISTNFSFHWRRKKNTLFLVFEQHSKTLFAIMFGDIFWNRVSLIAQIKLSTGCLMHKSLCRQLWGQELNWLHYPWVGTDSLCSEVLWISAKLCSTS